MPQKRLRRQTCQSFDMQHRQGQNAYSIDCPLPFALSLSLSLFVSLHLSLSFSHTAKNYCRVAIRKFHLSNSPERASQKIKQPRNAFFSLSPQFGNSLRFLLHFFFFFIDHYLNTIAGPSPSRKVPNHKNHFMPAAPEESETFCFLHFCFVSFKR